MSLTKAYKLVNMSLSKEMRSCTVSFSSVKYELGRLSVRPEGCGPLAAFSDIYCLIEWAIDNFHRRFYGEYRVLSLEGIISLDKSVWDNISKISINELPKGTVLFDVVRPIEKFDLELIIYEVMKRRIMALP